MQLRRRERHGYHQNDEQRPRAPVHQKQVAHLQICVIAQERCELTKQRHEEVARRRNGQDKRQYIRRVEVPVVHVRQEKRDRDREQRRRQSSAPETLSEALADDSPEPEELLLRRERAERLRQALTQLGEADRRLFYRKYYYLQSTAQLAAELGTTERAVEGRLYRIKKRLRSLLGGEL